MQNVPGNSDVDEAMLNTATAMSMVCPIGLATIATSICRCTASEQMLVKPRIHWSDLLKAAWTLTGGAHLAAL